jgi:hypothetical protein
MVPAARQSAGPSEKRKCLSAESLHVNCREDLPIQMKYRIFALEYAGLQQVLVLNVKFFTNSSCRHAAQPLNISPNVCGAKDKI